MRTTARLATLAGLAATLAATTASADHIWINEFHYDNPGGDVGEFVEVGIRTPNGSGANASDYAVEFYNGANGDLYDASGTLDTFTLINSFPADGGGTITLYAMPIAGIQNGAPDGIALVNVTASSVISFLSYEGSFTADADAGGIAGAAGASSTALSVAEPGVGNLSSLSAQGFGIGANEFNAASFALVETQTPGGINFGQSFIPAPATVSLLGLALVARRRRR